MSYDDKELAEIERTAVELANLAGTEISLALGNILTVSYKTMSEDDVWRDPVSEVDNRVEEMIRHTLSERFPSHGIIGEELAEQPRGDSDYVWAIDPVDGTANFINGFPLFSAAIGVLHRGVPVVGALWCATSHALRPGVYHGRSGSGLTFDGETLAPRHNPAVRRRLAGVPRPLPQQGRWEARKTGSAAIECAFVAAGLLEAARFNTPNIWDVAGGIALVQAVGGRVLSSTDGEWHDFESFAAREDTDSMRRWTQPLLLGHADPADLVKELGEI